MNNTFSIIVAEDDRGLNTLIQKKLQKEGFHTEGVLNGTDAIAKAAENQNVLLLLDYALTDMTGEEVIETLRGKKQNIPFIVMSGRGSEKIAVKMMKLGAIDYIVKKPGLTDVLHFAIKKAIKELVREKKPSHSKQTLHANDINYPSIFEHMPNGVACHRVSVDKDNRTEYIFIEVNSAFERCTGLNRRHIIHRNITDVIPEIAHSEPDLISMYDSVVKTGKEARFDFFLESFEKWYSVSAYSPRKDCVVSIFEDISDRKQAEKEFRKYRGYLIELLKESSHFLEKTHKDLENEIADRKRAEAEAMRASQLASLGELAAGVAHEVNNPINGIINYAQLLVNKTDGNSTENDISKRIMKEGERIAGIVQNLLSFAREIKEKKKRVRIHEIMIDTLALVEAQLRRDGITLKVNFSHDLPPVTVQSQQIEQVFLNIISNARYALNQKYFGGDECKILEITVRQAEKKNGTFIQILFNDNGPGIPGQVLDKVINPFFTTKPRDKGTGLGLSISNGIISDHGGRLSIESTEGEFTSVEIELPVKDGRDAGVNYTTRTKGVSVK